METAGNGAPLRSNKMIRIKQKPRTTKLLASEDPAMDSGGYKWPYHDSYVPNIEMNKKDLRVVRKAVQRQYFPKNENSKFRINDL